MIIYSKNLLLPITRYPKKISTRLFNALVHPISYGPFHKSYQQILEEGDDMYVGDFVSEPKDALLRTPNFGLKSFNELKQILNYFGQDIGQYYFRGDRINGWGNRHEFEHNWRPDNLQELIDANSDFYLKDWVGYPITQRRKANG
ncbi:MAG: hypothetical protein Unbinned2026contig1000_8 [Prokaryotic dsDNA virus sp.]|nr:MAG: hypothetical protein Unbinned2026contig1000_8 [Prokaryotic dsDNA virus sp.]